jgi:hypothetical protein
MNLSFLIITYYCNVIRGNNEFIITTLLMFTHCMLKGAQDHVRQGWLLDI